MKNSFLVLPFAISVFFSTFVLAQSTTIMDVPNGFDASKIKRTKVAVSQTISSAFNPTEFQWEISWPGRVSQYDLVYNSPPIDPLQGIALGNGDVGVLFWCEDSKIITVVNKSDLWDDATFGPFHNWSGEEEDYSTTQRHACRIIIDFKFPIFNTLYLSDFKAKLNLDDASLNLEAASPFGKVRLKAFVDHSSGILFYDLSSDLTEDVPLDVTIERFGSRTFSHWYSQINRDATIGLSGTETFADDKRIYITQKLSDGTFAIGGNVIQNNGLIVKYSRGHSRSATIQLSGSRQKSAQLAFSVTSPVTGDPASGIKNTLTSVSEKGMEPFWQSHAEIWKSIWNRSYMDYGDDYLNNLWYLTIYYANASQGGKYPGRFNNGLWFWNHDVQQWNFYFHWNQQQLYWPLNAAGFHELIIPYLDFRFNSLPLAKKDAMELFHAEGAFVSDVTERRGYNSAGEKGNHTPVAEIALDFWRQYQYTGDKNFLKEKALPYILEAAKFFESLFIKESDGLYHAKEGTGYEGWIKLKDGLTELVYAKALFTTALEALKVAGTNLTEAKKWSEITRQLAPLPVVKTDEATIVSNGTSYKLNRGFFRGETSPTNEIFAAGWGIKEKKMLTVFEPFGDLDSINSRDYPANGLKLLDGIFPSVPSSPVFPSGLIGLAQKDKKLFDIMTATTLLYGTDAMGWDPVPVVMARLGLTKELAINLDKFPEKWQIYCNGWGHIGVEKEVKKDAELFFRTNLVKDVASSKMERFPFPMWPFRHMSMESMSVLATAMNESLLQSYDGILRIFPAFPVNRNGRFTLHATGGFIVSSEIKSGEVQWISIKSLSGNLCKLELPWNKAVIQSNLRMKSQMISSNIAEIKTKANEKIIIFPEGKDLKSWCVVSEKPLANENVRYHSSGKIQLGIPRMF
jgi:alpha-L-fucosidase 2